MSERATSAGRVLLVGLPGPVLESDCAERLRRMGPAGVILFTRNLESAEQTARLLRDTCRVLPHPPLIALDQEGGRVSRLRPWIGETPPAAALAREGVETAARFGGATARAMRAIGFNVDFAPVVDLCAASATNGIGDRSFGTDPAQVGSLAGAFLDGLQREGVAGCLKHFPGLGPTRVDSHEQLPTTPHDRKALDDGDLLPFRLLASRSAMIMVGHVHVPAIDPTHRLPATLSRRVVHGLLREEVGYRGLVASDDLEMGAVAALDEEGNAAVGALAAGCDLLLYCSDLDRAERAADALTRSAGRDPGFAHRLEQAAGAVEAVARRWAPPQAPATGWDKALRDLRSFSQIC